MDIKNLVTKILPDEDVLKLVEQHRETMERHYQETDFAESMPILIVHGVDSKTMEKSGAIIGIADVDETMQKTMKNLGEKMAKEVPDLIPYCVTFSSEAWSAKFKEGEEELHDKLRAKYGKIENFPKKYKKEVAMVTALTIDGRGTFMSYDIKEKDGRRSIKLKMYKPVIDKKQEAYVLEEFYAGRYTKTPTERE